MTKPASRFELNRDQQRIYLQQAVRIKFPSKNGNFVFLPALLLDLSLSGIKVRVPGFRASSKNVLLEWAPVSTMEKEDLPLALVWRQKDHHVGFSFLALTPKQKATIKGLVEFHR